MFRKLISLDEARKIIRGHLTPKPIDTERISLLNGLGRIVAEDVTSTLDIPPFDRSVVDGYAVRAESTFEADENRPVALKVAGMVNIGEPPKISISPSTAAEIVTGAPIPPGADAVVMMEHTELEENTVHISRPVAKGENIMKKAGDIVKGETVLNAGKRLGSREIGVLAAIGLEKIKVYSIPKVAVISTGPEIIEPGERLRPGKIFDINAYSLTAAVQECGGNPLHLGVFPDMMDKLKGAIRRGLAEADLLITSGGVSVGPKDLIPQLLDSLGKPGVIICGVAIKPGKPVTVAVVDGKPIFSLPGHPASALLVFHLLVRPVIEKYAGHEMAENSRVRAFAGLRMVPAKGRRTFIMVRLRKTRSGSLVAEPVETGASGAITTLSKADGFVEIPENVQYLDVDQQVSVELLTRDPFYCA